MHIRDILRQKSRDVITIAADRTIHEAICVLNEHRIGALIVTDDYGGVCGIISERDILRECGQRCTHLGGLRGTVGPCPTLVTDLMTTDLIIGGPDDDLDYVMSTMTRNRIRHLPVLVDGDLLGIVSIGDVVKALVDESEFEVRLLKCYIQGVAV